MTDTIIIGAGQSGPAIQDWAMSSWNGNEALASAILRGVGRDAEYVVRRLLAP